MIDFHQAHQLQGPCFGIVGPPGGCFGDLPAHWHGGIEGAHGILENHGHITAPAGDHFFFFQRDQILPREQDLPFLDAAPFAENLQHALAENGFAAAGFSYQRQGFPLG